MSGFTTDYQARRDHADRLRKVILHSADALPDRVAEYLSEVAEGRSWRAKEQVLKTFVPLVDHLPAVFVDFALCELIEGPGEEGWASYHDMTELGIRGAMDYHPPAHVQGPFLRLLRTHEDEGLRLIHGLTNAATAYWCGRERDERFLGYSRTPLPVVLQFPSGPKELWGNEEVYCWFRHTSVAPNAVISALMALEVWMEEQLAAGRQGDELIGKVLADSQSVAVLGACVAVALDSLSKACLLAVLPALRNPLVWSMDIHRFAKDFQGSPIIDFLGENKLINQHLKERNQRPQRRREVRHLIPIYLFGDDELRLAAERAFAGFGDDLPLPFEEMAMNEEAVSEWRAQVERYKDHLRRERYRRIETSEWVGWQYQQAEELAEETSQELADYQLLNDLLGLSQWAAKTLKEDTPPDVAVMEQVVRSARVQHRPDDFREAIISDPEMDSTRQQTVAAVAAATAARGLAWARQQGHADWCRAVLLAAACSPRSRGDALNRRSVFHLDHKLNAAIGLTALVAQGSGDAEVRHALLGLVLDRQLQVVQALFTGLRKAWGRDEILCWNCLGLALSFAVVPGNTIVPGMGLAFNEAGIARVEALWQGHAANLEEGRRPILPLIEVDDRGFFLWDLAGRALQGLPLEDLVRQPEARAALLPLADGLLGWTISENLRGSDDDRPRRHSEAPWEWNHFFLGWLAELGRHLTPAEAESHVLAPVRATWPRLLRLAADLLDGLLRHQVARLPPQEPPEPQALRTWEQVCRDLLGQPELARWADEDYLSSDWSAAVTMMIFVNHGMYVLKEEWPHVPLFGGIIDRWLEVVGTNHEAYRAFLTMLKATSRHFPPSRVVGWLSLVASRSEDVKALWQSHNNGERTARVLHALWQASRQELTADRSAFRQFSELTDRLAASGVTLASVIQHDLEGLNAG
jgi:hypothetical protein